jgi:hypothetical protein
MSRLSRHPMIIAGISAKVNYFPDCQPTRYNSTANSLKRGLMSDREGNDSAQTRAR